MLAPKHNPRKLGADKAFQGVDDHSMMQSIITAYREQVGVAVHPLMILSLFGSIHVPPNLR
jgi:hypothetical protein